MTRAIRMGPVTDVINNYVASNKVRSKPVVEKIWRRNLNKLANQLSEVRGKTNEIDGEHYVYVILDPRYPGDWSYVTLAGRAVRFPHKPIYVGKGKGARSSIHSSSAGMRVASFKTNTIAKIRAAGLKEIVLHSKDALCSDWLAQAYEIDLIATIGRRADGGPLTNLTRGGEGASGAARPKSSEHREKLRRANLGKTHTPETRARLSALGLGRPQTKEHRAKLSDSLKGRVFSESHRQKLSQARSGVSLSDEHIASIRRSQIGKIHSEESKEKRSRALKGRKQDQVSCPRCNQQGAASIMRRWHFDNCVGARPYHKVKAKK